MPNEEGTGQEGTEAGGTGGEKMLAQSEVNRLVGEARKEGRKALLKELGAESKEELSSKLTAAEEIRQAQQTETEKANERAEKAEEKARLAEEAVKATDTKLLRARLGREKKLPEAFIDKLVGADEESILAEIDELLPFVKGDAPENVGDGSNPANAAGTLTPDQQMANAIAAGMGATPKP